MHHNTHPLNASASNSFAYPALCILRPRSKFHLRCHYVLILTTLSDINPILAEEARACLSYDSHTRQKVAGGLLGVKCVRLRMDGFNAA